MQVNKRLGVAGTVREFHIWLRGYGMVSFHGGNLHMRNVHSESNPPAIPTVLVLDDEPFVRHAARRFLKGSGYGCVETETVAGAIELLHSTPVIAAMLDMRLPCGRTGLDVLADLRKVPEFRDIPVLIVTGSILTEEETTAITKLRGFVFFKPEGFSTIVNFLDRLTGRDHSG
jgi:two-component system chemotaxis response regulator CheY